MFLIGDSIYHDPSKHFLHIKTADSLGIVTIFTDTLDFSSSIIHYSNDEIIDIVPTPSETNYDLILVLKSSTNSSLLMTKIDKEKKSHQLIMRIDIILDPVIVMNFGN